MTTTRDIFAAHYDDLTLSQRINAVAVAEALGHSEAKESVACGGEIGETATATTYYYRVVEPEWVAERISDATLAIWDRGSAPDAETDPRVHAFIRGWNACMEALAESDE